MTDKEYGTSAVSIVVSWNVKEFLEQLLRDLQAQRGPVLQTVVVVDNASEDGSAEMVRDRFPAVRLLQNPSNRGYTFAVNQAIRTFPEARYYFLLNPDIRCGEGTLGRFVREAEGRPRTGIVGCRIENPAGNNITITTYPRMVRGLLVEMKAFWWQWNERREKRLNPAQHELECVEGSCMLIRGDVVRDIGFFDERFWAYFEETDFCLRARGAGWKVSIVTDLVVTHYGGRSFHQRLFERRLVWNKSFQQFLEKYHPVRALVYPLLVRILWTVEYAVRSIAALYHGKEAMRAVNAQFKSLVRNNTILEAP
ncbi:MAG: glycosyltransferase family 2 protein [Bacteroidota bacterium]